MIIVALRQGDFVRFIFLCFMLVPIIEIWILIRVGSVVGGLSTIALVVLTAIIGLALLRQQSWAALSRAQSKMHKAELPATEMIEGLFLAFGGALLITPGFITDAIGFFCLIPVTRNALIAWWLAPLIRGAILKNTVNRHSANENRAKAANNDNNEAIEGEFHRDD